jgi:hypothetical protein
MIATHTYTSDIAFTLSVKVLQQRNVRFGSKADISDRRGHVR